MSNRHAEATVYAGLTTYPAKVSDFSPIRFSVARVRARSPMLSTCYPDADQELLGEYAGS